MVSSGGGNMLRPNPESNGGQDQIIHDEGRPEHVIGPSPYIYIYIYIYVWQRLR